MLRRTFAAVCIVFGLSPVAIAQVKFERKYPEGATRTVEIKNKLEQRLTLAGMDIDTGSNTTTVSKSTIGKRDVGGMLRVHEKIESLQISTDVMGQNYSFDSANPDNAGSSPLEVLRPVHKAISQCTSTTVLDKDNRVYAIEFDQDIVGSLPPEVQPLLKAQFDQENLKKAANQEFDQLTSEPVNKGDSWQRTSTINFGAGQIMTFQTKFTYEGTVEKQGRVLDQITSKTLAVDFALQDSPLPFQVKGSELKADESGSVILFDRERGHVVESNAKVRVTGDITFVVNNMELPSTLDLKMQSSVVVK